MSLITSKSGRRARADLNIVRAVPDEVDRRILRALATDARMPNNALAERAGVAASTCLGRVRSLRDSGVIRGYHADIDPAALGRPLQAMIAVRLQANARAHIPDFMVSIAQLPEVLNVFFLGGADDFFVHIAATNTENLRDFVVDNLNANPDVALTETNLIFDHIRGGSGVSFPEPTAAASSQSEVLLRYLDYFRGSVSARVAGLSDQEVRASRVPSGWTPRELVVHLTHVERRWLEWGFEGRAVDHPWGDQRDGRWHVDAGADTADLLEALQAQGAITCEIVRAHTLTDVGAPGPRWDGAAPASLERVLLHLMQEYARHLGHLDIVAEQAGGAVGE